MVSLSHRRQRPPTQAPHHTALTEQGGGESESEMQRKPLLSAYCVLATLRLEQKHRTKEVLPLRGKQLGRGIRATSTHH